jgi:flagellar protein FliT
MDRENFIIAHYESISNATAEMLEAARRNDWDGVVAAERDCARIIEKLKELGDLAPRDPSLRHRKAEIIRKVLADDAEVRYLTEPWLRQLEGYLRSSGTSKKLGHAYGASTGNSE